MASAGTILKGAVLIGASFLVPSIGLGFLASGLQAYGAGLILPGLAEALRPVDFDDRRPGDYCQ